MEVLPPRARSPSAVKQGWTPLPPKSPVPDVNSVAFDLKQAARCSSPPLPSLNCGPEGSPSPSKKEKAKKGGNQQSPPKNASRRVAPAPASAPVPSRRLDSEPKSPTARSRPTSASHKSPSARSRPPSASHKSAARLQHIPLYDSGHFTSPGSSTRVFSEDSVLNHPGSPSTLTQSFTSPTNQGLRRPASAVFPRASRDFSLVSSDGSPDVGGSLAGGIGARAALSKERNPPAFTLPTSTREREANRWRARDDSITCHGPADYKVKDTVFKKRSPMATIGRAPRTPKSEAAFSPGPSFTPESALRRNHSAVFGTASRKGFYNPKNTPGPSDYRPQTAKVGHLRTKGPSARFGSSHRKGLVPTHGPGVGAYSITSGGTFVSGNGRRAPSFGFSTAKRF